MKLKNLPLSLIAAALLSTAISVRARTHDVAFSFRMGAGFIGDVNRTSPSSILPSLLDTANPVRLYGDPVITNSAGSSVRGFLVGDTTITRIDGILVRPFPSQQASGGMSSAIGAASPPVAPAVVDVCRQGFILVKCNNFAVNPPTKGGAVFVWIAATAGNNIQGGFVAVTSVNTVTITNARFNGAADSTGVCEIETWAA